MTEQLDQKNLHSFPFYGKEILRDNEQTYIKGILMKYKNYPVNEELKQKIWEDLQMEKYLGKITIPFKVVTRGDSTGKFPPYIEVILDTKV